MLDFLVQGTTAFYHQQVKTFIVQKYKEPQAEPTYYEETEISTSDHKAWANLGNTFLEQGNYPKSLECYEKATEITDNLLKVRYKFHEAWYNLGLTYYNQQNYEKAIECYQRSLEIKPDDHEAIGNIGWIYFIQGKFAEAEQYFEKSISFGSVHEQMNLGHIRLLQGRTQDALALYAKRLEKAEYKEVFFKTMQDDFQYLAPHGVSKEVFEEILKKLQEL